MKKVKKVTILCLIAAISVLIAIGCSNDNSSDEPEPTPAAAATEDTQTPAAANPPAQNPPAANPPAETSVSGSEGDNEEEPENPTYTITFNKNGGNWVTSYIPQQSYESGSNVTLPDNTKIKKAYYRFLGWFENESDTEPVTSISNIDGNKSYIAKWEAYTSPAGKYLLPDGTPVACRAGTYSSANSRACTACPEGTVSSAGASTCMECASGQHPNNGHSACVAD